MSRLMIPLCLGVLLLITSSASADEYYYYYKSKIPLSMDTSQVAILERTKPEAKPTAAMEAMGVVSSDARGHPIKGWWTVPVPPAKRRTADIEEMAGLAARQTPSAFVSPTLAVRKGHSILITPEIVVGFRPDLSTGKMETILSELNIGPISDREFAGMKGVYRLSTHLESGFAVLQAANRLAERAEVRFAEPDFVVTAECAFTPNDTLFANQWALHNTGQNGGTSGVDMRAQEAWDITTGSPQIIVVVLDVGVDLTHPDLPVPYHANFATGGGDGGPDNGFDNHGTAVAGCIGASINNSLGVVGIAPGCSIASARIAATNPDGHSLTTQDTWVANALAWATNTLHASVTNMSIDWGAYSATIDSAYNAARNAGIVNFAAAGNSSLPLLAFPASSPYVNGVAAVDSNGNRAGFSNWGTGLAFSAPGVGIYTTDRVGTAGYASGDYEPSIDGTSFASPYAAGVAALVRSVNPNFSVDQVEDIMHQTCRDLGASGYDTDYGWGMVDAYTAVQLADDRTHPGTWIDFGYAGNQTGSFSQPFNTVSQGVIAAPTAGTIYIKAGTTSETLTISKPLTIVASGGSVTIGRQ